MNITGLDISVIGAKRSGLGAAKLIKKAGGNVFVSDLLPADKLIEEIEVFKEMGIEYETGRNSEKVLDSDLIVVSPGVPSDVPILKAAAERGIKIISEIELAAFFCKGKVIAITGTNGKTTTTALTAHIFNACGVKAFTAGNIGTAFSEIVLDIKENEYAVLEVSSFQLDLINDFKPNISVILNITPDHLNRYDNKYENYITSKMRIYENQDDTDYLILNRDNTDLMESMKFHKSKSYYYSLTETELNGCYLSDGNIIYNDGGELKFSCRTEDIFIKGEHNIANAMSSIIAAKLAGLDNDGIKTALRSFKGVEHRLEMVREIEGVKYINDSKATNVDSVWYALRSYNQPIFLILGGQDKGNDYDQIIELVVNKVKKIYAIGSSADKIFNYFHAKVKVEVKSTLEEAVLSANREARENDVVLLSPACASFDMFKDYEHRGLIFKEAVNRL